MIAKVLKMSSGLCTLIFVADSDIKGFAPPSAIVMTADAPP